MRRPPVAPPGAGPSAHALEVGHTWDGHPLPPEQRTRIWLEAGPDGEHLRLLVDAPFHGDPAPAAAIGPTPRLWEHEVVELFVAGAEGPAGVHYTEVELSPHGHHLVLRFEGVRRVVEEGLPLPFRTWLPAVAEAPRWRGEAVLPRPYLPPPVPGPAPYRANAYAIHGTAGPDAAGRRSYRAAHPLPGAAPDFHQPHRFPPFPLPPHRPSP